jgi:hypothetical protein
MTFKQFAYSVFTLPAKAFAGIVSLVFGDFARKSDGSVVKGEGFRGLLGLVLDGVKFLGKSITNFLQNHKQAIATAFWASLAVAGAAVLTVALWPAALAAVTAFSVYGVSIASVVGTGFAAQLLGVGVVAAVLTSAAVYASAAVVNTLNAIKNFFTGTKVSDPVIVTNIATPELEVTTASNVSGLVTTIAAPKLEVTSASKLSALSSSSSASAPVKVTVAAPAPAPVKSAVIFEPAKPAPLVAPVVVASLGA